jgi:hypothetical protein
MGSSRDAARTGDQNGAGDRRHDKYNPDKPRFDAAKPAQVAAVIIALTKKIKAD